jgi:hypothetical protein
MSESKGLYDYCRIFVDGAGSAADVERRLLAIGHYQLDVRTLRAAGVLIDVRRNKAGGPVEGFPDWLTWPVTMEVYREADEGVDDATMLAVVRQLKADLEAMPSRVVVAAEFEDEL